MTTFELKLSRLNVPLQDNILRSDHTAIYGIYLEVIY